MLNLYCYHSPISSSVGFQEAGWTVSNGSCSTMDAACTLEEVWQLLHSGGLEAICMDTNQDTCVFMARGISVRQGMQSGWQLNFAFEADSECDSQLKDLIAAFLKDYDGFTKRFAALFSVSYDDGEHYSIDKEGFLRLIYESTGSMDTLKASVSLPNQETFYTFTQKLCEQRKAGHVRILLMVPTATVDYFMRNTTLRDLPAPECCIGKEQWDALLAHEELPKVFAASQGTEPHTTSKYSFSLQDAVILGGGLAAAALVVLGFQRMLKKRQQRHRR